MSLNLCGTNSIKPISEKEKLQKQTKTIKKFFKNRINVTFQARPVFQNSDKVLYIIPDMHQNKECLENGEGSIISTSNQILIKHERSEDINSITEQHSYGNKDHSKDDEKVKVEILVPKLKHETEEVDKIKCIEC